MFNVQGKYLGFLRSLRNFTRYVSDEKFKKKNGQRICIHVLTEQTSNCAIGSESETVANSECEKERRGTNAAHNLIGNNTHKGSDVKATYTLYWLYIVYQHPQPTTTITTIETSIRMQHIHHRMCVWRERTKMKCAIEKERMIKNRIDEKRT